MKSCLHDRRDGQTRRTYARPTRTNRGATDSPQRPWDDKLTTKPLWGERLTTATVRGKQPARHDYSIIHIFDATWTTPVFFLRHSLSVGQRRALPLLRPAIAADGHDSVIEPHAVHVAPCRAEPQLNPRRRTMEELVLVQHKLHLTLSEDELVLVWIDA